MENDKQIYLIFQAEPQWLYFLAGWHSPGPSRFESVNFKAIESRSDGILVCEAVEGPMTVVEVQEAGPCYTRIKNSMLPQPTKEVLLEAFLRWIEQRLSHKGKKEIEEMMLGQLPDLRDTQSGRYLIAIGKLEGKREDLLEVLEVRFGRVSTELKEQILKIDSIDSIERIYKISLTASKLSEVFGKSDVPGFAKGNVLS